MTCCYSDTHFPSDLESYDDEDEETQTQYSKDTQGVTTTVSVEGDSDHRRQHHVPRRGTRSSKARGNTGLPKDDDTIGEILNTSYEDATPLFKNIEKENWQGVLTFLNTSKWGSSFFASTNEHMKSPSPSIQARTWVTSYDKRTGDPEWSQLPLHAALSYSAPYVVIQKLIEMFPKAVQCTDREGMLPIHLAFGFGAPDNVLALLLESFPASLEEKGVGGRLPYECCELGPNKVRGKVYNIIAEQTASKTQDDMDKEWKQFTKAAATRLSIPDINLKDKTLTEFLLELMEDRKELIDLKQKLAERLAKSSKTTNKATNKTSGAGIPLTPRSIKKALMPNSTTHSINTESVPKSPSRSSTSNRVEDNKSPTSAVTAVVNNSNSSKRKSQAGKNNNGREPTTPSKTSSGSLGSRLYKKS